MPASDLDTLHDLETPIETMLAHLFAAQAVTVYAPANSVFADANWMAANPDLVPFIKFPEEEIKRARPRVEIICHIGKATGHLTTRLGSGAMDEQRLDSFEGSIIVSVISAGTVAEHRIYRARIRNIMAGQFPSEHLPFHDLNRCEESGTNIEFNEDASAWVSTITFEIHANIKPDAWPV